jgi:glycosyltransferase involved in cell wall biosynthesis
MYKLSVISPVYKAEKLLYQLVEEIEKSVSQLTSDYEIILVEDNSPDQSWQIIQQISRNNPNVTGIRFSRNFGQQEALHAGMKYATGDFIVTLDCDLQDNPSEIIKMKNKVDEGYDIILAGRIDRKDDFLKKIFSKLFYRVLNYLSEIKIDPSVSNYVFYRREALDALLSMGDYFVYYPFMVNWIGFRKFVLPIEHQERMDKIKSSYSFKKRFKLAFHTIISFSDKPLRIVLRLGVFIVFLSLLFAVILSIRYLADDQRVQGWMSVFLSLWLIGGLIISVLGMVGIYVGNTFEKVKSRPNFIIREIINSKEND